MVKHDMEKARTTYSGFMSALKWTVPILAVITLIIIMLIAE